MLRRLRAMTPDPTDDGFVTERESPDAASA